MRDNPNTFANNPLNRAAHVRTDAAWLESRLADSASRIVPLYRLQPLIDAAGEIGWLAPAAMGEWAGATCVFLGLKDDIAHFAVDISDRAGLDSQNPLTAHGRAFIPLRDAAPRLPMGDAAILAQAKALVDWHRRHGYCSVCGQKTVLADAGYKRDCASCGAEHFPRTDPVVITLVVDGDKCLLARGAKFPGRMFSALAGFIEPGETIEEAVAREVEEEVGVKVGAVRYHSTQPWPFPSSLMIGCIAAAVTTDVVIDPKEIAEARWIERATLRRLLARETIDGILVPPPVAIAHQLLSAWVSGAVD